MKVFTGRVVRKTNEKTAFVEVDSVWMHPIYRKAKKITTVFPSHDEVGVKVGNEVSIVECRPMSKTKRFKVLEVIKK